MSRPRGQPSPTAVDHGWPHQVALPVDRCTGKNRDAAYEIMKGLSAHWKPHDVTDGQDGYHVFCFSLLEDALHFKEACGGIPFYPEDRKGRTWKRPPGDVRRPPRPRDPYDWS